VLLLFFIFVEEILENAADYVDGIRKAACWNETKYDDYWSLKRILWGYITITDCNAGNKWKI